jgi:hypothetical protein
MRKKTFVATGYNSSEKYINRIRRKKMDMSEKLLAWKTLDEETKYEIWSKYCEYGIIVDYSRFCDLLDFCM